MKLWPGMVFGLIGLNMCIVGVTLYAALSDDSFAVEPDFYRKALAWDEDRAARERSAALGWTADLEAGRGEVRLALRDAGGAPVSGASVVVRCFASARAGTVITLAMREASPGRYEGRAAFDRAGLWEFRVEAVRGADRFEVSREIGVAP